MIGHVAAAEKWISIRICAKCQGEITIKSNDKDEAFRKARAEHEAFVTALGRLTLEWSDLETVLYKLLNHYAGVTEAVGRAIFSGTRAKSAMDFIRAIADNTSMEIARRADLDEIFSQAAAINTMRDFLVHHVDGSEQEFEIENPQVRVLTDAGRASRLQRARLEYVGSATLNAMCDDCLECCWRLHAHWTPNTSPFQPGPGTGGMRSPWKFTPPQPQGQKSKSKGRRPR